VTDDDYVAFIETAAGLASEDGENPEYDRGMAELIADSFGIPGMPLDERTKTVLAEIRYRQQRLREQRGGSEGAGNPPLVTHTPDALEGFAETYAKQTTGELKAALENIRSLLSPDPDQRLYDAQQILAIAYELRRRHFAERPSIEDLAVAFALGCKEADGDVGMTYDDDPNSLKSRAYDFGRTIGRERLGIE
jgi:hypothetical protein